MNYTLKENDEFIIFNILTVLKESDLLIIALQIGSGLYLCDAGTLIVCLDQLDTM